MQFLIFGTKIKKEFVITLFFVYPCVSMLFQEPVPVEKTDICTNYKIGYRLKVDSKSNNILLNIFQI